MPDKKFCALGLDAKRRQISSISSNPGHLLAFYRKGTRTHFDILDKQGKLDVVRQPIPWSLSSTFGERLKDVMESLMP